MSLFNIFDIAGSGMSAQSLRLNTTASNLANVDSVSSSINQTYKARQPVFATVLDNAQEGYKQGAVQVQGIVESQAPVRQEYNPSHPMANEDGYIFHSNVDPITEMANMMSASRSYQNNVEIANTSKQLLLRTLQLGQ
ncbi:MAG: flagellar basal body rod protein FlgC [Pseudomonadota bacterium]|jgi:flagellar basal-body rod protein FlgC|uniref:Flagellar basal-body rod protein FlgC n=3 Tax=Methylophaga TaxID=40222 RepID=F5SZV1_9GAMM|nr:MULTISPECIES: flagellar basal body rod protein FlgC [Methylophaga]MEC9411543.1 flagellar basal body rod protein FlgC [Pseudomonadota bacterium]EGL54701.1 flagellar basal body rod protein [Methylophaga aminisulfidivorans MP]WVI85867.1 flagellar basal body rod protein FlgC [Methylophaga thalassica]SFK11278.1 flagellar basal-body rod protein FlgC [Methylophaga sulfidovorans]GLQ01049.1 flagellar basal-body rod protein FlgC [Methylophaga thalassica]